ncbi:hypothetical protein A3SI_06689 [Nitritalea halalkaliphila LW7]|uniref:Uncharacterized protein n=1 Tax=Nitritalea halalkaliphila LW7 TaxID=1189621 RepID=I5C601_9BACT|nr:hypothetical protein [Nitritalea halalkaliphila]EIM77253.1 hypothetical protein A3SI_06689 [Nitritalea halalkaliphila LW7]
MAIGLYQKHLFKETYLIAPANDVEAYWQDIEELIERLNIDYAVILPELEVIEWRNAKKPARFHVLRLYRAFRWLNSSWIKAS